MACEHHLPLDSVRSSLARWAACSRWRLPSAAEERVTLAFQQTFTKDFKLWLISGKYLLSEQQAVVGRVLEPRVERVQLVRGAGHGHGAAEF